ncbi:MAG TPA: ATP-binding protein [Ktedonobacteraceae bacterium]|nr:ATP-binding protein [Ktedonobacteraceae bacterium]
MDSERQGHLARSPQTQNPSSNRRTSFAFARWYSWLIGYVCAVIFAAGASVIPWLEKVWGIQDYFIEPPFVIAVMLVAWFWGLGPALLALLLEVFALDYWFVPPVGGFTFFLWPDIGAFAPFLIIQLIVLRMILLQKAYRQRLIRAQQVTSQQAEALAERNRGLMESNAELDRANRFKEYFFSLTSHELRAPLTLIRGQAQLALRRLNRRSPLAADMTFLPSHLEKITVQTQHLEALVSDLLNFSSLRSGYIPLRRTSCDLCQLCREVVEDQRAATGRSIDLIVPIEPIVVYADEGRLSQVMINLVTNAIKYSPTHSIIKVMIRQGSDICIVIVHNDGAVIAKEQQEKIFEPLYRTPEAQTSEVVGWGLGLAISKEIVAQHDGRIWVESMEGEGTTFGIELSLQSNFPENCEADQKNS